MREAPDKTLSMPRLIVPSLRVNILAGHLLEPDKSEETFLKVPVSLPKCLRQGIPWQRGFCCGLSGIEAEDCSLASLRQIFLTLPAAGA